MTLPRAQLLDAFRADLREYLDGMRAALSKLDRGRDAVSPTELDEVYRQAHGLRAAARACDFTTVEQIGRRLEQFFGGVRKETLRPDPGALAAVRTVLDATEDWGLSLAGNGDPVEEPAAAVATLDRLLGSPAGPPVAGEKPVPPEPDVKKASPPRPDPKDDLKLKLRAAFQEEHKEHLGEMRSLLTGAGADGLAAGQIDEVFRRAHSLKGAARIAEIGPAEVVAHRLESLFAKVREGALRVTPEIVRAVHHGLDAIEDAAAAAAAERTPPDPARVLDVIEAALGGSNTAEGGRRMAEAEGHEAVNGAGTPAPSFRPRPSPPLTPRIENSPDPDSALRLPPSALPETLRVGADHLDRLLRSAGELQSEALQFGSVGRELADLGRQLDILEKEWDGIRGAAAAELRRLAEAPEYARVYRHLAAVERQVRAVAKVARGVRRRYQGGAWSLQQLGGRLHQDVRRVRMVSADSVFQGFHKMVRDLARDEGKEVEFRAAGLDTPVDRAVLQVLKDPLMHALTNAVTHGVERPDERTARGKPEAALVTLRLETAGNRLRVSVEDDGRGIDPAEVAAAAVRKGLLTEAETAALSASERTRLVLRPAFSTAQTVTAASGRGMGLSVVQEAVARLQGEVEVLPAADGPGTRVVLSVPLSVATQRLLFVTCRGQTYGVPLHAIERLVRVRPEELESVEGKPMLMLAGRPVPIIGLAGLLDGAADDPAARDVIPVAVLRAGGRRTGVVVDAFLAERSELIKPLDGPAARVGTLAGGVLLGDGSVALVLNPAELLTTAPTRAVGPVTRVAAVIEKKPPVVLVVDDSLTTRTLEKSILEVNGFTVRIAVDGVEGLAKLRAEAIDLVITDVEMPRMTGFQMLEEMKRDPRLARTPVIVVTSLAKREDQERGLALGADAYIVKRKFDHQDLLDTVRQLI